MALPSSWFSDFSTCGNLGFASGLSTPHFMRSANGFSTGLAWGRSGEFNRDARGGRSGPFADLQVQRARLSGRERYSIHLQAASDFLVCANITSESPAIVVLQPAVPFGSGAAAHLPSIFGNSECSVPANQAPATYIPTLPCANATRPS